MQKDVCERHRFRGVASIRTQELYTTNRRRYPAYLTRGMQRPSEWYRATTNHHLLLTAYCLLLTAYCLLLTAHCSQLTEHQLLLGASVLAKPGCSQRPGRPIKSAHEFPDQAAPVILNR
jgi:hypothetical protein